MALRWPESISELVNQLSRLPGIGEKTATRLAFFVLDQDAAYADDLAGALVTVKAKIRRCSACGSLGEEELCDICTAPERDRTSMCIVESFADLVAIERTGEFRGLYHVLHGLIRPLDGVGPEALNLPAIAQRVEGLGVREVIVATDPSVEGEATAMYIRNLLDDDVAVTRIARGLPMGGEVEYADRATLGRAISARERLG